MATLPKAGAVGFVEMAKAMDPDGSVGAVAELLAQSNEMLTDMITIEGNLPTGNQATVRTALPTVINRNLYQGVAPTASQRSQIVDTCAIFETRSEVDLDALKLNGNDAQFRLNESYAFMEAMNQSVQDALIYGNQAVNANSITGLAPRYASLSGGTAPNIIDAAGVSTDNTSIWLVGWSPRTVYTFFPKADKMGLLHEDIGIIDAFDSNQNRYRAYADRYQWKIGFQIADWRYCVRIANVDVSDLVGQTGTQAPTASTQLMRLMLRAMQRFPTTNGYRPCFYMNRTVKEMLAISALDKSNNAIAIQPAANQFGIQSPGSAGDGTMTFFGVACRTVDRILETRSPVPETKD